MGLRMLAIEETSAYWRVLFDYPPFNIVVATIFEGLQDLLARMDFILNLGERGYSLWSNRCQLIPSGSAASSWEGDYVMVHSRYSNPDGSAIVVVDIMRIEDGIFQEHWDVIQPEGSEAESKSKLPMFGDKFRR